MEISNRLQMLIDFVPKVKTVADIGCDHGYVAIALAKSGNVDKVIAMDINKGPLKRAKKNIIASELENQVETRLSNGFEQLQVGEVNLAILAGMGGRLMRSILTKDLDKTKKIEWLVLQPQSEIAEVRKLVATLGYVCIEEKALLEDNQFYFAMLLKKTDKVKSTNQEVNFRFGKHLLQSKDPILLQFILQKKKEYCKIMDALSIHKVSTKNQKDRIKEIQIEMQYIASALEYYDGENMDERKS